MKLAIKTKTIKEYKQAIAFLYAFGHHYCNYDTYAEFLNADEIDYGGYPIILLNTENEYEEIDFSSEAYDYKVFTWIKDHDAIVELLNMKTFTMKLTDDYNAEVTEDGIIVGCQTIDFDTFQELVELVELFQNQ